jgi:tetratricopeptide (TPR) repeat protein
MKRTFVCFVVLLLAGGSANVQPIEMTLSPSRPPEAANKLRLWPEAEKQIAADAVPLYSKAAQSLPNDLNTDQISQLLKSPLDKLPQDEVKSILEQLKPALQLVEQAVQCSQCNWPAATPPAMPANLREYRTLAQALALKARFEMAQARYDQAAGAIRTGLVAAKQIGEGPTLIQGLVGVAIGALTLRQVEEFVQGAVAPNIHEALRQLPKPLVDLNKAVAIEMANLKSDPKLNVVTRQIMERQAKPAHDRALLTMKKLDRQAAALQCIEALRLYAGTHNGELPEKLSEITEAQAPDDPIIGKPFGYSRMGANAVLEAPSPEGGNAKDAMRYELKLRK